MEITISAIGLSVGVLSILLLGLLAGSRIWFVWEKKKSLKTPDITPGVILIETTRNPFEDWDKIQVTGVKLSEKGGVVCRVSNVNSR